MNKRIKIIFFTMILAMMQLTACGFHRDNSEEYKTPSQQAEELQIKIMDCFVNKDKNTLKGFFSEYTQEHCPELEEQIEEAFALFDGEIVSYDEPEGRAAGGFDDKSYGAHTEHILTDQGTEYWLTFSGRLTCVEDESKVGILYIKVVNMTECNQREKGDRDDYIVYIGTGY